MTSKVKVLHSPMQTEQSKPGQTGLSLLVHVSANTYLAVSYQKLSSELTQEPTSAAEFKFQETSVYSWQSPDQSPTLDCNQNPTATRQPWHSRISAEPRLPLMWGQNSCWTRAKPTYAKSILTPMHQYQKCNQKNKIQKKASTLHWWQMHVPSKSR